MNEKLIERKLVTGVRKLGGKALKFYSPFETGYPDRLVLMPAGKVRWVELKSTGKKQTPRQQLVSRQLAELGFPVTVIDNEKELIEFLNSLEK